MDICVFRTGGKADLVIHLRGNLEEAKELVVTPDDVEEDSDSDKDQDPEAEVHLSSNKFPATILPLFYVLF